MWEKIKKIFLKEKCIQSLIAINAIVMFLQCYYPELEFLQWIDNAILSLFILEVILKVRKSGWKQYWAGNWNKFDFIVTLGALLAFIQSYLTRLGLPSFEFILALRIFRGFRLFRTFRYVPDAEKKKLFYGFKEAIKSTYVIIFAFLLSVFILSIITTNLFSKTSPEYFNDPLTSLYSIFRLFTVEGWYDIPNAVASSSDSVIFQTIVKLFFSVLLFLGGIIGMSFINSIIVDAMASDNNDQVLKRIKELEDKIDKLLAEKEKNE